MTTVVVNIPDKKENLFLKLFKKHHLKTRVLSDEDLEDDEIMAKWINEGLKSEDIPVEKLYEFLRKHGVNC